MQDRKDMLIAMMLTVSTRGWVSRERQSYRGRHNRLHSLHVLLIRPCWQMPPSALLARAPLPIVLTLPRLPPSCSLPLRTAPSLVSVWRRPLLAVISTSLLSCRLPPELPECPDCGVMMRKGVARESVWENVGLD